MKAKALFFKTVFLFVFSASVFCATRRGSDLVPSGHWIYDSLASIELDLGRWHFVDQTPLTVTELKKIVDEIPEERLSDAGKESLHRINQYFKEYDLSLDAGVFSLGIEPRVSVEGYLKTNEELKWLYDYHDRQRLLEVPLRLSLSDYLTVYMGFALGQRRSYMTRQDNFINHIFTEPAFDPNLTHTTYLSLGYGFDNGVGFNFNFGMEGEGHNFGRASLGSTVQSDWLTDLPYVTARVYSPVFTYAFNVQQLNEFEVLYTHEIDFRLFKKFTFGFTEGGAAYKDFDMDFLNPFGIFHAYELYARPRWISYFGMKYNFVPCKNLRLYFMMSMTEHQLLTEQRTGPGAFPEARGYQGGVDLQMPVGNGFIKFNLEGYYASPYLNIKESPNWSLVSAKGDDSSPQYEWIGSPLGPDSAAGKISAAYENPGRWSLCLNYIFAARGEFSSNDIFTDWIKGKTDRYDDNGGNWIYVNDDDYKYGRDYRAPHGVAEYDNVIYLRASYSPSDYLSFTAQPAYIVAFNHNHIAGNFKSGFEAVLSCSIDFCRMLKKPVNLDFVQKDRYDRQSENQAS